MTNTTRSILCLSLLTIIIRLSFLFIFGGLDENLHDSMSDQYTYLDIAKNLVTNRGFSVSREIWIATPGKPTSIFPPLYPLFIAGVFQIFGQSLIPVRLLQVLLSVIVVLVVYLIGSKAFNQSVGLLAGFITTIYPPLIMYVRPIMSEGLFFPLVALLIWITYLLLDQDSPRLRLYFLWGLLAGLAILTRTEIVLLIGLLLVYLIYHRWQKMKLGKSPLSSLSGLPRNGGVWIVLLLSLFLTLLPYAFYNYSVHGKFSPLPNARWKFWDHTWWAAMREHPEWQGVVFPERHIVPDWDKRTELERDTYLWNLAVEFVSQNPKVFLEQRVKRLFLSYPLLPREEFLPPWGTWISSAKPDGYQFGPTSLDDVVKYITPVEKVRVWSFRFITVCAIAGISLILWRKQSTVYWLILILFWNMAHSMAFVGSERLRLQIDPYLILLAAFFLNYLWMQLKVKNETRLLQTQV